MEQSDTNKAQPKLSKRDIKRVFRHAFAVVVENFNHLRSILGTSQAVDYSRMFENTGKARDSATNKAYVLIDFTIDVEKAIRSTLNDGDLKFFHSNILDKPLDLSVQSEEYIEMQEQLGRVFFSRGIYPLQRYFSVVKK